mmetsp:Transcript_22168/g.66547  ORF Transcript_22168/g.66547 Transcript_22168/m.66547 type:complete len:352 (+) Transcript_22168:144-1199(+)
MLLSLALLGLAHALRAPVRMAAAPAAPHVVVVGGGWGGLGAAQAAAENGCRVTLVDGGDPAGAMTTPSGKPFEPGMRGFWKDYPNINALGDDLGLEDVYTDFTESSFFGPEGLECSAPVFSGARELPSPLGQVFASFDRFKRLPVADRVSIAGLLYAMLDLNRSPEVFAAYDRMSAHELFRTVGVTKRLVDDFLKPTLLVGLFKPPEELSAAVTMELLYFYALAHQTSFDVRWLARGTVGAARVSRASARVARPALASSGLKRGSSSAALGPDHPFGAPGGAPGRGRRGPAAEDLRDGARVRGRQGDGREDEVERRRGDARGRRRRLGAGRRGHEGRAARVAGPGRGRAGS